MKHTKTWKVALVGVGGRGQWAVDIVATDPRLEAVALVDLNEQALEIACQQLQLPPTAIYRDLENALSETGAEVAIICTPMVTHGPLCRIAFRHGVHVLVEKGMTFSWEEAKELVAAADEAGVRFCVAQNYRYRAEMQAISAILNDPSHPDNPGEVSLVDCMQHRYRPDPLTSIYPFAMVWDMSCHHLDLLLSFLGPLRRVWARTFQAPWSRYGYPPNITAFLEFESGAVCNYLLTHDALLSNTRMVFQGPRGVLRFGEDTQGLVFQPMPEQALRNGAVRSCEVPELPRDVALVTAAFLDYLEKGIEPGISARRNLETMAACALLVQSATENRPVCRAELT